MVVYAKAGKAVLGVLGDVGDVAQNFLKSLGKKSGTPPVEEFSPSLKAAEALKQEKGSYEQLKATMINKHGAKEAEMDWSGANDLFAGKTVTKGELVDYLSGSTKNYLVGNSSGVPTDLIKADTNVAKGKMLGSEAVKAADEFYLNKLIARASIEDLEYNRLQFGKYWPDQTNFDEELFMYLPSNTPAHQYSDNRWFEVSRLANDSKSNRIDPEEREIAKTYLDNIAKSKGMSTDDFVEKYSNGWVLEEASDNFENTAKNTYIVANNKKEASDFDWNVIKKDVSYQIKQQNLDLGLYDFNDKTTKQYLGEKDYEKFSNIRSPDALTYTSENFPLGGTDAAETVYRFDDPTGIYDNAGVPSHHFNELPDDNVLAHTRTAQFPVVDGGKGYHLGEVQSDVYQNQRRLTKLGREPGEELRSRSEELAYRDELEGLDMRELTEDINLYDNALKRQETEIVDKINKKLNAMGADTIDKGGLETAIQRGYISPVSNQDSILLSAFDIYDDFGDDLTNYTKIKEKLKSVMGKYTDVSNLQINNKTNQFKQLPYGESTNQWVDMVLRKELAKAIDSGSEFMTIPSSDLVRKYTSGSEEGQGKFYFTESELGIVPKRLTKLGRNYDPNISLIPRQIITEAGNENVMALPLTQKLIDNIMNKGLPKYAVPITGGSLGALSFVEGEQQ